MDTLLVTGTTVAGLIVGAVLDPFGQREAERSRMEDERRRADRRAQSAPGDHSGEPAPASDLHSSIEHLEDSVQDALAAADADDSDDPAPEDRTVRNLMPSGPAPARTAVSTLVTGALFGAAAAHFGRHLVLAPFCAFFAMLVVVSMTDLTHRLVPRRLIYGSLALIVPLLVVTAAVDHTWHDLTGALIAGAAAFGLFFAIWWFIPRGMGFGDVRLAGAIGFTTGWLSLLHAYVAFLAGFVVGMVFGLVLMVVSSAGRKTRIPFAPSLSVGAVITVLWGAHLAQTLFHAGT